MCEGLSQPAPVLTGGKRTKMTDQFLFVWVYKPQAESLLTGTIPVVNLGNHLNGFSNMSVSLVQCIPIASSHMWAGVYICMALPPLL